MVALLKMPSPLKLTPSGSERRMFQRKPDQRHIAARRLDHSVEAHRFRHVTFSLQDLSVGGMGAIVEQPLAKGERVSLFFPPESVRGGFHVQGRVVRCERLALGYRIGVAFDAVPAAA